MDVPCSISIAFYAGSWACQEGGNEDDVNVCIAALQKMRWAFSAGETRIETLRFAWENRPRSPRIAGHLTRTRSPSLDDVISQLRNPGILTELHLPIGLNALSEQSRDPFENYVYQKSNPPPASRPTVPTPSRNLSRPESMIDHSASSGYRLPPLNTAALRAYQPDTTSALNSGTSWGPPLPGDFRQPSPQPKMSRRSSIGGAHDSPTGSSHTSSYDYPNPQPIPPVTPDQPNSSYYLSHQQSFDRSNPQSYSSDPAGVWPPSLDRGDSVRHADSYHSHVNQPPQAGFHGHGGAQPYGSHVSQPLPYSHGVPTVAPDPSRHIPTHSIPGSHGDGTWIQAIGQDPTRHDLPQDGEDGEMVYMQEAQHLNRTRYPVEFTGDPVSSSHPPQSTQPAPHTQSWQ